MTVASPTRADGAAWLAAAVGGGLPEPMLARWQPLRVGIVNLWEFDTTELWFADGRMVLRGGNGTGKTKVLELTTLMLLRGEVASSTLDPFGSQHRTMRYNLIPSGEGDDPREAAEAGLGYAWAEFGRRDEHGQAHFFVCGLGASARRGTGTSPVVPWQFITSLRPGQGLHLVRGGYPIEENELKKLDGVWVRNNATQYRARLASELFGLDADSYDNLTELLKQLRKPKLGERLNPASLAETLRDSLPPLAAHEVTQLAEGWDHLDLLRRAVEQTEESAAAVAGFVRTGWRPWVRATVRRRADDLAEATTALDNTTRDKRRAEQVLTAAKAQLEQVMADQFAVGQTAQDRDTELRELVESQSYRDAVAAAGRVEELRRSVAALTRQRDDGQARLASAEQDARRAVQDAARARAVRAEAQAETGRAAGSVALRAPAAGLAGSAQRFLGDRAVPSLWSDLDARTQRFEHLRSLHRTCQDADQAVDRSASIVAHHENDERTAAEEEAEARESLAAAARALQEQLRAWAREARVAQCRDEQVEVWCERVADLTRIDPDAGTVVGGPSVVALVQAYVAEVREQLMTGRMELERRRDPLLQRRRVVSAELDQVRSAIESAPPDPTLWRRRGRPAVDEGLGAPLWRCVQPKPDLAAGRLDLVESALAAAGLLDAWLEPASPATPDAPLDTLLGPAAPRSEASLLAVLEPTPAGGVPAERVSAVLAAVGWYAMAPADDSADGSGSWLATDGQWRLGQLRGRVEAAGPASYVGATAREAARQRRIAALELEAEQLDLALTGIDEQLTNIDRRIAALAAERALVPAEGEVTGGAQILAERTRRLAECARRVAQARRQHRDTVQRRDESLAALGRFASDHGFPTTGLDLVEQALRDYRDALREWGTCLRLLEARAEADTAAQVAAAEHSERAEAERATVDRIEGELRTEQVRLDTSAAQLSLDHAQRLQRRSDLDRELTGLREQVSVLDRHRNGAWQAADRANAALLDHEGKRQATEQVRDAAVATWWQVLDAGLVAALGVTAPERRVVESALAGARAIRRDVEAAADPVALDRAWRRCYGELEGLRQKLLPNRDARVDDVDDASLPVVVVLADPSAGWQMPHEAADTLADRVREQREAYDTEQHRVLTTLLESTFIEHLKERLDHTQRTFTRINAQLTSHPTRRGHAVRLVWEADPGDPDANAVVSALRQGYQQLVPERQDMVRAFLARRIDEARGDAGSAGWKDRLAAALDYRTWLRITLQYRPGAAGTWSPFDSAKHAAKSGGEKVVLLSQPLFAAAVVAYDAAGPLAPRWVWLDEAMTGVDAGAKASFMGLTVSFELDVMLTAHDEWCNYQTVPAVAIYDLARHPHLAGVDVMTYLWCGGELAQVDVDRLGTVAQPAPVLDDGLFSLLGEDL